MYVSGEGAEVGGGKGEAEITEYWHKRIPTFAPRTKMWFIFFILLP